eukprot:TRINITY_DN623_c0_g2_i1.p1 TRINITY_DN623_c0_g2~~TRINITY_DN623_c0_g2_i1.p1  ORF type:complete len:270 (+),score=30.78 TRINITY_DN623_c0_g2_i1:19-828(+)
MNSYIKDHNVNIITNIPISILGNSVTKEVVEIISFVSQSEECTLTGTIYEIGDRYVSVELQCSEITTKTIDMLLDQSIHYQIIHPMNNNNTYIIVRHNRQGLMKGLCDINSLYIAKVDNCSLGEVVFFISENITNVYNPSLSYTEENIDNGLSVRSNNIHHFADNIIEPRCAYPPPPTYEESFDLLKDMIYSVKQDLIGRKRVFKKRWGKACYYSIEWKFSKVGEKDKFKLKTNNRWIDISRLIEIRDEIGAHPFSKIIVKSNIHSKPM